LSATTAVIGDQNYNNYMGCAHVFHLAAGSWRQVATLQAKDEVPDSEFGASVAISGSTIVVGAPGDQKRKGRVYVFHSEGGSWSQTAELQVNDITLPGEHVGGQEDQFGGDVAVSGGTIVATNFPMGSFVTRAGQPPPGFYTYVFQERGPTWRQVAAFPAGGNSCDVTVSGSFIAEGDCRVPGVMVYVDTKAGWEAGPVLTTTGFREVSMSGPTLLASSLGAYGHSQAVIYTREANSWVLQAKWSVAGEQEPVALSGDRGIIARFDNKAKHGFIGLSATPAPGGGYWERSSQQQVRHLLGTR
jgi:FG-GAP repeat